MKLITFITGLCFLISLICLALYCATIWHRDQTGESQNEN